MPKEELEKTHEMLMRLDETLDCLSEKLDRLDRNFLKERILSLGIEEISKVNVTV